MIALAVDPAGQGDSLANICRSKFATSVRFVHSVLQNKMINVYLND